MLTVTDITKSFPAEGRRTEVLRGVSLTMKDRETVALLGESGSGKSTLLHIIGTLEAPDSGSVRLDGVEIAGLPDAQAARHRRGTVAVIFQQFNLIPSLTTAANIGFQARLAGRDDTAFETRLADRLGLTASLSKYPEQLSGGQQQRVAIARALAARPRLLLADEPTGNLDAATGDAVMDLMLDLAAEAGTGLLMVTHSERLAARLSRQVRLDAGRIAR